MSRSMFRHEQYLMTQVPEDSTSELHPLSSFPPRCVFPHNVLPNLFLSPERFQQIPPKGFLFRVFWMLLVKPFL